MSRRRYGTDGWMDTLSCVLPELSLVRSQVAGNACDRRCFVWDSAGSLAVEEDRTATQE